jgi:hypothetical protein
MMAMSFVKVYFDFEERTEMLNEVEQGRLLLAMLRYAQGKEPPELKGGERFLFPVFKMDIDRDANAYASKIENGAKGGRPAKPNETEDNRAKPNETEDNPILKNKNKNKNKNKTKNNGSQEEDEDTTINPVVVNARAAVERAWVRAFGKAPNPGTAAYIAEDAVARRFDAGVIAEAVRMAGLRGASDPVAYVGRLFADWALHGIRDVDGLMDYLEER